jgi:AraC family transcriptional regulator of adaptative response/methylated-DNA-[protein]-cysteine methyltransferase
MTDMSRASGRNSAGEIRFSIGDSSLGPVLVAGSEKGVCAVLFGDDERSLARELRSRFPDVPLKDGSEEFDWLADKVIAFVEDPVTVPDFPMDPHGTDFEQKVWAALCDIPPGETATYGEIAKRIGMPRAAREVGEACASNPIAVAIPCHRVVKSDGSLSGYRWGVARKRKLLNKEALACPLLRNEK